VFLAGWGWGDVVAGQLSVCSIMIKSEIKNFVSTSLFCLIPNFLILLSMHACIAYT
jgi:hypothetical protein